MPALHQERTIASNLDDVLAVVTPTDIFYNNINVDYDNSAILINAQGSDLIAVNTYVDILKFANFRTASMIESESPAEPAFSSVLTSSINTSDTDVQFSVQLDFDPRIFDEEGVSVTVPDIISTRSETERPRDIFDQERDEQ